MQENDAVTELRVLRVAEGGENAINDQLSISRNAFFGGDLTVRFLQDIDIAAPIGIISLISFAPNGNLTEFDRIRLVDNEENELAISESLIFVYDELTGRLEFGPSGNFLSFENIERNLKQKQFNVIFTSI